MRIETILAVLVVVAAAVSCGSETRSIRIATTIEQSAIGSGPVQLKDRLLKIDGVSIPLPPEAKFLQVAYTEANGKVTWTVFADDVLIASQPSPKP